jgi:hypothetical protein
MDIQLTVAAFRRILEQEARELFVTLADDNTTAVLFAEAPTGEVGEVAHYDVSGLDEVGKVELALDLNVRLQRAAAVKAGWLMPGVGADGREYLLLLVAGPEGSEAVIAGVGFGRGRARLGPWSEPTVRVEGLFVTPLAAAVASNRSRALAECRARGWYAKRAEVGWEPCDPSEPGAREDLNRWVWFRDHGYDGHYEF